jgi:hypothetical protein
MVLMQDNLKPKIGHKDINNFLHEHVALTPSTIQ